MSSGNIGRSSFVVGALVVFVVSVGCHKETSHRVRHAKQHNNAATVGAEDEAPAAPSAPTANVVMPPPAAAPPAPPPPPPPAARELTVESSTPVPMPPRRASRHLAAAAPAPAPTPQPEPARPSADRPPGSRCEGGTAKGERLSVQGVAADDVLNVREAPDKAAAVLGALPPDATGVRGTQNRRRVGASIWREVECGNLRGWVNERFLARDTGSQ
jgi:hypothetical protein